ncbi:hypothetical protein DXG03_009424 [Asterophora parasitica]|uniref:Uncharacterized protein n=1 Tax=Asterophora parasitica TaxID=117018 RepID=A0A9P7KEE2_9AGAR|nr:hypothetical protein DXG03_009424 [Asterophora parasitica]
MDRPLGPRQPPDKRHAAYEDIFGRPGAPHHHTPPSSIYGPPVQPYPYQQSPVTDRRSSYASFAPSLHNQPPSGLPPSTFRPQYYPAAPPQHPYPQQIPGSYGYPNAAQSYASPHPSISRARSTVNTNGVPALSEEPPDMLQHNGLTPAQAYQAQIYLNNPSGPNPNSRIQASPGPSSRPPSRVNAPKTHPGDAPRLGVSLDHDDGRLGLDFGAGSSGNSSDQGTDDGSSELPWARDERANDAVAGPTSNSTPSPRRQPPRQSSDPVYPSHYVPGGRAPSVRSSIVSNSTSPVSFGVGEDQSSATSGTLVDPPPSRRLSDSSRMMPKFSGASRDRTAQDRSLSMSAAGVPSVRTIVEQKRLSRLPIPSSIHEAGGGGAAATGGGRNSPVSLRHTRPKTPIVYPALLSRVAEAFRDRIPLTDKFKDGLTYKDAFDGREAVDKIAYIIKTTDRNLALLLGRALDAQKFFHDVTYDHRLRDSGSEVYQFRTKLPSPFVSGELQQNGGGEAAAIHQNGILKDFSLPSGGAESSAEAQHGSYWVHSVPQEIVNSVSPAEKNRQEAIHEVVLTEQDFVADMEYLRDYTIIDTGFSSFNQTWIGRLKDSDIIPADRKTDFLTQVFWNLHDIINVTTRLRDALNKRQKQYAIVERIGDILLDTVPHFGPFVQYGAHQLYGKYEFEKEKSSNQAFAQFVENSSMKLRAQTTERLPISRKLELNAYLTKPTTRLARYPLLLEAVLKHTPEDSPDKIALPKVVTMVRGFLVKVNEESGKTENRFNLMQLEQQLYFKPGEEVDLRLKEEGRQLVGKDVFNKRDGEIQVYLFDHALVFTKPMKTKQHEQFRVYRRPIPIELLLVSAPEDAAHHANRKSGRQALVKRNSFTRDQQRGIGIGTGVPSVVVKPEGKGQHWINFIHLGRKSYSLVLWAPTAPLHKKWLDLIVKQQQATRDRSTIFDTVTLSDGFFHGANKVNCAAPFNGGRKVVYGTNDGVYISDLRETNREPTRVLALLDVLQVDVLEDYQLLIVLSERQVITFPLDALDANDPTAGLKRAKRISSHTSFFKAGFCLGRVLVCIVKSSQLSSTFKTLEPIDQNVRGRAKPTFRKLLQGGNDTLKLFREFYIPVESTSIHYLKTKMCVGCSSGFEIVDLESLDTQGLLDPNDESLEFVRKRESLRPMAIYRILNEFLLCYDEFAFYVNKNGRRSRKDFMVHWEGNPTGFALHEPYVLAFEPSFVEIRHIETGQMSQVIQGSNLRLLFADTPPSVTNTVSPVNPYPMGYDYQNPYAPPQHHPGYGAYAQYANQQQYAARNPQGIGRDEILIVSDDRVLALRTTAGPQRQMSDAASMSSR